MPTTAQSLMDACARDEIPDLPVLADYFGKALYSKNRHDDIMIIFGVYQGMCKTGGISAELLHNCLLSNRLNELVHAKHQHRASGCSKMRSLMCAIPFPWAACLGASGWIFMMMTTARTAAPRDISPKVRKSMNRQARSYLDARNVQLHIMARMMRRKTIMIQIRTNVFSLTIYNNLRYAP